MKILKGSGQTKYNAQPAFRNVGALFAVTGCGLLATAHFWKTADGSTLGLLLVSGIACLAGSFLLLAYRDHTVLDTVTRTYCRKKGFLWGLKTTRGSFEDFAGIEIEEMRTPGGSGSSTTTSYIGQIAFRVGESPIQVVNTNSPDQARCESEEAARTLGIPFLAARGSCNSRQGAACT